MSKFNLLEPLILLNIYKIQEIKNINIGLNKKKINLIRRSDKFNCKNSLSTRGKKYQGGCSPLVTVSFGVVSLTIGCLFAVEKIYII